MIRGILEIAHIWSSSNRNNAFRKKGANIIIASSVCSIRINNIFFIFECEPKQKQRKIESKDRMIKENPLSLSRNDAVCFNGKR